MTCYSGSRNKTSASTLMISEENREFVNWLFDQLTTHTDTDMIDLHDSDSCDDHLQLELLSHD